MKLYTNELDMVIENKIKPNLKSIYNMKVKGLKDKHIAQYLGISVHMFTQALANFSELSDVYDDATLLLCSQLREVAIERALGTDGKTDKDGQIVGPDANLALRILERLDPAFSNKQQTTEIKMTVEHVIHEISEKRREEEKKRKEIEEKNRAKGYDVI